MRNCIGDPVLLHMTPVYERPEDTEAVKFCSGEYYLWDAELVNGRYPIAKSPTRCGIHGHIFGWVDAAQAHR